MGDILFTGLVTGLSLLGVVAIFVVVWYVEGFLFVHGVLRYQRYRARAAINRGRSL